METIPRVIGIIASGGWIVFSALNYESAVANSHSNQWLKGVVILGIVGGPALLARLSMDEGRARERAKALRSTVRSLCRVLSIPLTKSREDEIDRMDAATLDALRERIERDRRWD